MDQQTFTNLTGIQLSDDQSNRFDSISELTSKLLQQLLGWPLDPDDFDNQYLETGISQTECACPSVETPELDEADEVQGKYRVFNWRESDKYLLIDPATTVYKVKLVKDGITYKVFDSTEYSIHNVNNEVGYFKYLEMCRDCKSLFSICSCLCERDCLQIAVDADWAFADDEDSNPTLPIDLQKVWADMIADELDPRSDIRSESVVTHSYTKFDKQTVADKYRDILVQYAGANGHIRRKRIT